MDIYYAPLLCMVAAWMATLRRNRTVDRAALIVISVVVALIIGLRFYSDIDYALYVEMWNDNPTLATFSADAIARLYGEPGYLFITAVFKSMDTGFPVLALVCGVLGMALKAVAIARMCRYAALAMCSYLAIHFLTNEFIQLRWAVATGALCLAFYYQYRRQWWRMVACFALALAFHYFSAVFWFVALAVPYFRSHRALFLCFVGSLLFGVFLSADTIAPFLMNDSQIYILARLSRYAGDPANPLGAFSFLKLVMYPAIYALCIRARPSFPWLEDSMHSFLFRVAFLCICLTLAMSSQPVLHYRATVMADIFSIMLVLNAIDIAFERRVRIAAFSALVGLFAAWYLLDLRNHIAGDVLFEYRTWVDS
jgi:hypothetical protein